MAKARKIPSGRWVCEACFSIDGKKIRRSFVEDTATLAEIKARQFVLEHKEPSRITFKAASLNLIEERTPVLSPSTVREYANTLRLLSELFPEFASCPIERIESRDVQKVVNKLTKGRSPKTVRNYYGFITVVLKNNGIRLDGVVLPQKKRPLLRIPDKDAVKQMISLARGTELEIPILLAVMGTMRRGEICALKIEDIAGNVIHVHRSIAMNSDKELVEKPPKTYAGDRFVEVPEEVTDLIKKQGYVTNLSPDQLTHHFVRFLKKHGLPACRFHDLRHFSASMMHCEGGIASAIIMKRGGWSTEATLNNVYRHALESYEQKQTDSINQKFKALL